MEQKALSMCMVKKETHMSVFGLQDDGQCLRGKQHVQNQLAEAHALRVLAMVQEEPTSKTRPNELTLNKIKVSCTSRTGQQRCRRARRPGSP